MLLKAVCIKWHKNIIIFIIEVNVGPRRHWTIKGGILKSFRRGIISTSRKRILNELEPASPELVWKCRTRSRSLVLNARPDASSSIEWNTKIYAFNGSCLFPYLSLACIKYCIYIFIYKWKYNESPGILKYIIYVAFCVVVSPPQVRRPRNMYCVLVHFFERRECITHTPVVCVISGSRDEILGRLRAE